MSRECKSEEPAVASLLELVHDIATSQSETRLALDEILGPMAVACEPDSGQSGKLDALHDLLGHAKRDARDIMMDVKRIASAM